MLKKRTTPDLSINSPDHQAAIASGNEQYTAWQYNVADHFKGNSVAEIRQTLKDNAHPFAVAMENWTSDFNFSSLVRNANGFNAKEVFYIGDKKVDRRGMTGTHNYTDVKWMETIEDFLSSRNDYVFVAIDNVPGSVSSPAVGVSTSGSGAGVGSGLGAGAGVIDPLVEPFSN